MAKRDAPGVAAYGAAVSAFEASSLIHEENYAAIFDQVKAWAEAGNSKANAAEWIRRLMITTKRKRGGGGGEGLTPSEVRKKIKGDPRRGA